MDIMDLVPIMTFVVFILIFFLIFLSVVFSTGCSEVLITDTGESIPYDSDTCNIIESTNTIVVKQDGSIVTYSYNDWYYIDTVKLPSNWDRFVEWLRSKM